MTIPRPKQWSEFVGQRQIVERLGVMCTAARERGGVLDHILFAGGPGLGKTSLAELVALEMETQFARVNGTALQSCADVGELLVGLERGAVLFVDEIHRVGFKVWEVLYGALEDYRLDLVEDFDGESRTMRVDLQPFCFIGATTRGGLLPAPMRRRFRAIMSLDFYSTDDLAKVVEQAEPSVGIVLTAEARLEVAKRAGGTPNAALTLLTRLVDYHQLAKVDGPMTAASALGALLHLGVYKDGLDALQIKVLRLLAARRDKRAGLQHIAAALGEDVGVLQEMIEPLLLRQGYLGRMPAGRFITDQGLDYLAAVAR